MRAEGKRLVLTNGCFDLLHVGHVRSLRAASELGDVLAGGVNGDASARRIKGPGRPLTPQDERVEILSALEVVDYVVVFDEDTALELVTDVQPAVYVKGGDYSSDPSDPHFPPEGHVVLGYGGTVAVVDYLPEHSTTRLINALRDTACDSAR